MRSNRIGWWLLVVVALLGVVAWSAARASRRPSTTPEIGNVRATRPALAERALDPVDSGALDRVALEDGAQAVDDNDGRVRLEVRVVHFEDGLPVEGAFVRVVDRDRVLTEGSKREAPGRLTNAAGLSSWRFAPGTRCRIEVSIADTGDALQTREIVLEAGSVASRRVEFRLAPWVQFEFHARFFERTSGLPIPGLVLELCGGRRRWTCDADGRFAVVGDGRGQTIVREPTRWTILQSRAIAHFCVVSAPYLAEEVEFDRDHPDVTRERVVLVGRSAALKGRVLRPDGSVGRDTSVRVVRLEDARAQGFPIVAASATTDARGRFEFERLPSGQALRVVARGLFGVRWYAELALSLEPGETRAVELQLATSKPPTPPPAPQPVADPLTVHATATVFRPDGSKATNAKLFQRGRGDRAQVIDIGGGSFEMRVAQSGWFSFEAVEGEGSKVSLGAFRSSLEITHGAHLEIHLVAPVEIRGKVVDEFGEPVGDVWLDLRATGNVMQFEESLDVWNDGSFRASAFPGEHDLRVSGRYFEAVPYRVTAPAAGVVLTLPKLASIRGLVVVTGGHDPRFSGDALSAGDRPRVASTSPMLSMLPRRLSGSARS